MLRLTGTERAVAEISATAEHMASLTAAAAAFQLEPDWASTAREDGVTTVGLLDEDTAPDAAATLAEIRSWARDALGFDGVPAVWRAFANHPGLLDTTWRKNRLILGTGALDELTKGCAALAVAQFRQSRYWVDYQTRYLRHSHGFDDRTIVEATGMMMHSLSFNTIAHGMKLHAPYDDLSLADFEPGGRLEDSGPGAQPQQPSQR